MKKRYIVGDKYYNSSNRVHGFIEHSSCGDTFKLVLRPIGNTEKARLQVGLIDKYIIRKLHEMGFRIIKGDFRENKYYKMGSSKRLEKYRKIQCQEIKLT